LDFLFAFGGGGLIPYFSEKHLSILYVSLHGTSSNTNFQKLSIYITVGNV
jgi:hypothetical protein